MDINEITFTPRAVNAYGVLKANNALVQSVYLVTANCVLNSVKYGIDRFYYEGFNDSRNCTFALPVYCDAASRTFQK